MVELYLSLMWSSRWGRWSLVFIFICYMPIFVFVLMFLFSVCFWDYKGIVLFFAWEGQGCFGLWLAITLPLLEQTPKEKSVINNLISDVLFDQIVSSISCRTNYHNYMICRLRHIRSSHRYSQWLLNISLYLLWKCFSYK